MANSRGIEFGVCLPFSPDLAAFAGNAEALGLDYLACGEHFSAARPTPNSLISLAVAAGATRAIRLVSSVTLVPLYPPPLLAKMIAALDVVCGGRFDLGIGVGGEIPADFDLLGVPRTERAARASEALEIIDRLLTEPSVTFDGRFTRLSAARLDTGPVQKPRIPFWVCGRKRQAMERAVRYGDVWMPYLYTPRQLAASIETLDQLSAERWSRPWQGSTAVYLHTTVYGDGDMAVRVGQDNVGGTYNQDFSGLSRLLLAGNPQQCVARLGEYVDAGATRFIFRLACPASDIDAMLRLLVDEVIGPVRAAS
jgi:alkanesulfonate monooxygenase SsuD/methylene tetrahydromethanopterin reductase-like flavin-dependent oxidoreductase (luciferase family)